MKIETVQKLTFEPGDLFFVVEGKNGSTYRAGDFILLKEENTARNLFTVDSPRTVTGACSFASFTKEGLEEQVKAGVFVYQGNVKK